MHIATIHVKSALTKSKLPDTDYVINPYIGCQFSCLYCYASFMGRFVGENLENWGNYLYAKANILEIFKKEYLALRRSGQTPRILLSSVTDAYQGIEKRCRLTRGILEILAEDHYPGLVSILTKSPMILRDTDLLLQLPKLEVGLTVTSTDDRMSQFLEIRAPNVNKRLDALSQLNRLGISTYAFLGPLLPHFRYLPSELEKLISAITNTGTKFAYVEHMNLKPYILYRLKMLLKKQPSFIQKLYGEKTTYEQDRRIIEKMVLDFCLQYGLQLKLGEVLMHGRSREERRTALVNHVLSA